MIQRARLDPTLGMTADEAAVYWVLRHDRQDLTAADRSHFDAWLDAGEANAQAYRKANGVWDVFENSDADPHLAALRQTALATGPERKRWLPAAGVGIAASIVGAVAVLSGQFTTPSHVPGPVTVAQAPAEPANAIRHATEKGQKRVVRLPDGTRVTLNTDTMIALAFTPGTRRVRLTRGQALFEVAHDASRPFMVEAADRRITALGTVFEVRLDPGRMKVVLVEGRVVVDHAAAATDLPVLQPTILRPGQELVAELGVAQRVRAVDVGSELMWREGYVSFDDTTLASAVVEMNRYTVAPIRIGDGGVAQMRISGVFRTGDADRFAALVAELLPVRIDHQTDGGVVIAPAANGGPANKSSSANVEN
jgi:transmembrane sensor